MKGKGTPATITLFVDGKPVGSGDLPVTIPLLMGLAAGVSVGADPGAPVTTEYEPPFAFTGTIARAVYDVSGERVEDHEAEFRIALARQWKHPIFCDETQAAAGHGCRDIAKRPAQ